MTGRRPLATPVDPAAVLGILRVMLGVMFVWVFFENRAKGLYTPDGYAALIKYYVDYGKAPAAWKAVMAVMLGQAHVAAPMQGVLELGLGIFLLAGALTRLVGLGAFLWLAGLWVSEWGTAWIWELLVPMVVALCLALGAAGRRFGVDAILARRYPAVPLW